LDVLLLVRGVRVIAGQGCILIRCELIHQIQLYTHLDVKVRMVRMVSRVRRVRRVLRVRRVRRGKKKKRRALAKEGI
jgi:hypothetical protein